MAADLFPVSAEGAHVKLLFYPHLICSGPQRPGSHARRSGKAQLCLKSTQLACTRGSWGGKDEDGEERAAKGDGETTPGDGFVMQKRGGCCCRKQRKENAAALRPQVLHHHHACFRDRFT